MAQAKRRAATKKKVSETEWLAKWFVANILEREWVLEDYKGQIPAHAKQVLKDYPLSDICGCLQAVKDGLFGELEPTYITIVRKLEPSLMNCWLEYKKTPPPVYLEATTAEWQERVSRKYGPEEPVGLPVSQ